MLSTVNPVAAPPRGVPADPRFLQVQLPAGSSAGSKLRVRLPSGQLSTVTVPNGSSPGDFIRTSLPSPRATADDAAAAAVTPNAAAAGSDHDAEAWGGTLDSFAEAEMGNTQPLPTHELCSTQPRRVVRGCGLLLALVSVWILWVAVDIFLTFDEGVLEARCAGLQRDAKAAGVAAALTAAQRYQCTCADVAQCTDGLRAPPETGVVGDAAAGGRCQTTIDVHYGGKFVRPVVVLG
jgi:hypothetical protein